MLEIVLLKYSDIELFNDVLMVKTLIHETCNIAITYTLFNDEFKLHEILANNNVVVVNKTFRKFNNMMIIFYFDFELLYKTTLQLDYVDKNFVHELCFS